MMISTFGRREAEEELFARKHFFLLLSTHFGILVSLVVSLEVSRRREVLVVRKVRDTISV